MVTVAERVKEVSLHELQKVLGGLRENNWQWRGEQQLVVMLLGETGIQGYGDIEQIS